jgi:hypothetical protein
LHHFQPVIGFTPLSGVYCRQDETLLYPFVYFKRRG